MALCGRGGCRGMPAGFVRVLRFRGRLAPLRAGFGFARLFEEPLEKKAARLLC